MKTADAEDRVPRIERENQVLKFKKTEPYKCFPGVEEQVNKDTISPFQTEVQVFKSLNRKEYIYKQDILVKIQQIVHQVLKNTGYPRCVISSYSKTALLHLKGRCELVRYDEHAFLDLKRELLSETREEKVMLDYRICEPTVSGIHKTLACFLPKNPQDPKDFWICNFFSHSAKTLPIEDYLEDYENGINIAATAIKVIRKFMKKRPRWFHPKKLRSFTGRRPVVRLFEGGENHMFVIGWELLKEMENARMDVTNIRKQMDESEKLGTFTFKELFGMLGAQMKQIEFVKTPLNRILGDEQPIVEYMDRVGGCIMYGILENCVKAKLFHGASREKVDQIMSVLDEIVDENNTSTVGPHLLLRDPKLWGPIFKNITEFINEDASDIKEMKCFTENDLDREVSRLGLERALPCLLKHNHDKTDANKRDRRNTSLKGVLQGAQLTWIIWKSKKLQQYLHRTKSCQKTALPCPYCDHHNTESFETFFSVESSHAESNKSEEPIEDVSSETTPTAFSMKQLIDELQLETTSSKPDHLEDKEEKRAVKRQRQVQRKKLNKLEQARLQARVDPQSKSCAKCAKSSQLRIESEDKLKAARVTINSQSKQLAELELLKIQNERTVRSLKEKINTLKVEVYNYQQANVELAKPVSSKPETASLQKETIHKENFPISSGVDDDLAEFEEGPGRSSHHTPEVGNVMIDVLLEHLRIRDSLSDSLNQTTRSAFKLMAESKNEAYRVEVKKELNRFESEFEEYKRALERNIDWIQQNSNGRVEDVPSLPEFPSFSPKEDYDLSQLSLTVLNKLLERLDLLNNLDQSNPVRKATELANQLIQNTQDECHVNGASHELKLFKARFDEYKRAVEDNIQWIKSHPESDADLIPSLPTCPKFSDFFNAEYQKVMGYPVKWN